MKKLLFYCIMFLSICACSDEENLKTEEPSNAQFCETRSLEEAVTIARNAINLLGGNATRAINRYVDKENVKYVVAPNTRASTKKDTLFYVINYANNNGFAIVSANKSTEGLLAVTENGNYNPDNNSYKEIEGFTTFIDLAKEYAIANNDISDTNTLTETRQAWLHKMDIDTIRKERINPIVTVEWGQNSPEGNYAPNNVAGCSNVAMAQIMSYFCYPSSIALTYTDADIKSQILDWEAMKQHTTDHFYKPCYATNEAHAAIARLHRQLGELNKSEYTEKDGTGTVDNNVRLSFEKLGYTVSKLYNYDDEDFHMQLKSNKLMYMRGSRKITDPVTNEVKYTGHAWVVDGYYSFTIHASEWRKSPNEDFWQLIIDYPQNTSDYIHINWGYNGDCNGLFSVGVFALNHAYQYDHSETSNDLNRNYEYSLQYFEVTR